jgi:hypothetical protein
MSDATIGAERFDELLRRDNGGRRLDDSRYPWPTDFFIGLKAFANESADWLRRQFTSDRPVPHVVFEFVDAPELNGVAIADNDRLFMGLNVGGVTLLLDLFYRLLAEPSVLKHIGDAQFEQTGRNIYPLFGSAERLTAELTRRGLVLADIVPRDPLRKLTAEVMATYATGYLVGHELRHLIAGHRAYLNARRAAGDDRPTMSNQALEMDADAYAVDFGLRSVLHKVNHPDKWPGHWRAVFPDHERALTIYLFAICGMYRSTGFYEVARSEWEFQAYPPERTRMYCVPDRVIHRLMQWNEKDALREFFSASGRALADVERGISLITGEPESWDRVLDAVGTKAYEHLAEVMRTWNDILPELRKFSHVPLYDVVIH